ncbi:MAG: enoyl-CoA hydratase/isomerase family protein [Thermoplasmatota archaeon]
MADDAPVLCTLDQNGIATITINRPDALNALNERVLDALHAALVDLRTKETRGIILTGAGDKAFVAGADIAHMVQFHPKKRHHAILAAEFSRKGQQVFYDLERFPAPVIAAINGFALGGGLELAMACDILIASDKAKLGLPEAGLGVIPGFGGTQRLPRRVGQGMAKLLLITGDTIDAAEAERIGLVDRTVPQEELLDHVTQILKKVARNGPLAIQTIKRVVNKGAHLPLRDAIDREADAFGAIFETKDQEEGMRAFLEKRRPVYRGE